MRFAPEVHEIDLKGRRQPIKSKTSKRALRDRMNAKMDFLNQGQYQTLADGQIIDQNDPNVLAGNLMINTGAFGGQENQEDGAVQLSTRSNRRTGEGDVECLEMEVQLGEQKYVITIYPDSVPDALAHEFAAQHGLSEDVVPMLCESI